MIRMKDGKIITTGKDIDDFYAYDGSEEYEEEYDDINDRADYEYEKMMDERVEER